MALNSIISRLRRQPPPPPPAPSANERLQQLVLSLVRQQLDRYIDLDLIPVVRAWFNNLNDARAMWPVLLPLLAWSFWRTYHKERRLLKATTP